jgi:benzylsuccinate CoA-transferase BbsF subunit
MNCLSGIRVVDFSWVAAGSYCALMASYLGAEVIKVESRHRLDITRYIQPKNEKLDVNGSALFNEMSLGKRSLTLNLSTSEGIAIVQELIKISDVMIENFRPGVMKKLGLDYKSVVNLKPDIVMVSYSLSGQNGPEANYLSYAPIAGCLSGLNELIGYPDEPPGTVGGEFDLVTGAAAFIPVLAALYSRQKTGKGQYVDFSSREAGTCFIGEAVLDYAMNSRNQMRDANRHETLAPHNCYRCRGEDMWVSIVIGTDEEWGNFCRLTGHPEWVEDVLFCDAYQRWQHQEEIDALIEEWTSQYSDYEVMAILQKGCIAAVPSFNTEELSTDIHVKERGFLSRPEHPVIGNIPVLGVPWILSGERPDTKPGPLLGEANHYVLHDLLGLSEDRIKHLERSKVIY